MARLADKLILLKKLLAQFGYPKQAANLRFEGAFTQSRGGACTGIFSFQQMGRSWQSMR